MKRILTLMTVLSTLMVTACSGPCGRGMVQTETVTYGGFAELGVPDDVTACVSARGDTSAVTHYRNNVSSLDEGVRKLETFMRTKGYEPATASADEQKAAFEAGLKGEPVRVMQFKKGTESKRYSAAVADTGTDGIFRVALQPLDCADRRNKAACLE